MELIFRKAEEKDAREWQMLLDKVWRDAYKHIFPEEVFLEKESRIDARQKRFEDVLVKNDDMILYVVEDDGKLVGAMMGEIKSGYDYFHDEYADLVALYIDPNYQGQKIGTKLKSIFEEWAKGKGATKYVIGVLKDNWSARKVYEAWGGKLSEYESDFIRLDVPYIEVFYTYDL